MDFREFKDIVKKAKKTRKKIFIPKDEQKIVELTEKKITKIEELERIDKELILIQRSTKTSIPQLATLHNYCRMRWQWYYKWHMNPKSTPLHIGSVLLGIFLFASLILNGLATSPQTKAAAAPTTSWTGAVDGDWSNAANWSAGVPDENDDVLIDNFNDPVISPESPFTVKSLTLGPNFTFEFWTIGDLNVTDDITIAGGNFITCTNTSARNFIMTGGNFDFATCGNTPDLSLTGNLSLSGSSFFNPYSLIFKGGITQHLSDTRAEKGSFAEMTSISQSDGAANTTLAIDSDITIKALQVNANQTFNPSSHTVEFVNSAQGYFYLEPGAVFNPGASTIKISGTTESGLLGFPATTYHSIEAAGAATYSLGGNIALTGNLIIDSGATLTAVNGSDNFNIALAGNWTNNGSFISGTNTVTFNGSTDQTIITGGIGDNQDFNNVVIANANSLASLSTNAIDIDGALTINANANLSGAGQNIRAGTSFANNGTLTLQGAETVAIPGVAPQTIGGTVVYKGNHNSGNNIYNTQNWIYNNLTINSDDGLQDRFKCGTADETTINGDLTISAGRYVTTDGVSEHPLRVGGNIHIDGELVTGSSDTGTVYVGGNWDNTHGSFANSGSTDVYFDSLDTQTLTAGSGDTKHFYNFIHSGTGTLQLLSDPLYVDNSAIQNTAGTFDANGIDIHTPAGWENSANFISGSNTVYLGFSLITGGTGDNKDFNNVVILSDTTLNTNPIDIDGNLTIELGATFNTSVSNLGVTVGGDVNIAGALTANGSTISIGGNWTNSGTFTSGTGIVNFTGTSIINTGGTGDGQDFTNLTLNGTSATLSTNAIDIDGNFSIGSGTFNAAGLDMSIAGNWTNSASFVSGANTVTFDGTSSINTGGTADTKDFNNVVLNGTSATLSTNAIDIDGNLTVTAGTFNTSTSNLAVTVGGNVSISGTFTANGSMINCGGNWDHSAGTFTYGTSTVNLTGSAVTLNAGSNAAAKQIYNLNAITSGQTLTLASRIRINGALTVGTNGVGENKVTIAGGENYIDLTKPTDSIVFQGSYNSNPGYLLSNLTVYFQPATSGQIPGGYYPTVYITPNSGSNTLTLAGDVTVTGSGNFYLGRTSNAVTTVDMNGYNITSPWMEIGAAGSTNGRLINTGAVSNLSVGSGNLTIFDATTNGNNRIDATNINMTFTGNFINNETTTGYGLIAGASTTTTFAKTSGTQTVKSNGCAFNNVTYSGAGTLQLVDAINIDGAFTNSGGIFNANNLDMNVAGNWTNSGTFTAGTGTVILDGADSSTQLISGNTSFHNLTATTAANSSSRTIAFASGSTQIIDSTGNLALTGESGKLLNLIRSGGSGTDQWNINLQNGATRLVSYVNVSNSNATGTPVYAGLTSTDSENNTNWIFNQSPVLSPASLGPEEYIDSPSGTWTADNTPSFNFTITDPDSEDQLIRYEIQIDTSRDFDSSSGLPIVNFVSGDLSQGAKTYTTNALIDGQYYWRVKAIDDRGISSTWADAGVNETVDFRIDTTAPTGTLSINGGDSITSESAVNLNLTYTDPNSGPDKMAFSNDNSTWSEFESIANNKEYNLLSGDGTKIVYVKYKDVAGNISTELIVDEILLDTTAPTEPGAPSTTTPTNNTRPMWNWSASSDIGSGIAAYYVKIGTTEGGGQVLAETSIGNTHSYAPATPLSQGTYYLSVKAKDNINNQTEYVTSGALVVDITLPTGTVNINDSATYSTSKTVTLALSASDTGGSNTVSYMQFSNDNLTYSDWEAFAANKSWSLSNNDGNKTVWVQFKDSAGNISDPVSDGIVLDTTGPNDFSLFTPAAGAWLNSTTVNLTWEDARDDISGLDYYQLYVDDNLVNERINKTVTSATLNNQTVGNHTWYIKAYDTLGHEKSADQRAFGIDLSAPSQINDLRADNLSNNTLNVTNNTSVKFSWSAAQDQGLAGIFSYLVYLGTSSGSHDLVNGEEISARTYTKEITKDDTYYMSIKPKDKAGNLGESSNEVVFQLDTLAPVVVSRVASFDVSNLVANKYTVYNEWPKTNDAEGSGVKEYRLLQNDQQLASVAEGSKTIYDYTSENLQPANYKYKVVALDNAGNISAASPESLLTIDKNSDFAAKISELKATPSSVVNPENNNTSAIITWKTSVLATGIVQLEGTSYGVDDSTQVNTGHAILIPSLKAATTYRYKVISKDIYGNTVESEIQSFRTNMAVKSVSALETIIRSLQDVLRVMAKASAATLEKLGLIQPVQISPRQGVMVFNISDSDSNNYQSFVSVAKASDILERSSDGTNFATVDGSDHDYYIDRQLAPTTTYYYRIKGQTGMVSLRPDGKDVRVPVISDAKIIDDATQISNNKAQMAIAWSTDIPTISEVSYGTSTPSGSVKSDQNLNTYHLVVLDDLQPGTSYKFKIKSIAGNGLAVLGNEMSLKTPRFAQQQSILETIIKSLQDAISRLSGWLRK